jgi:hypothetical protein
LIGHGAEIDRIEPGGGDVDEAEPRRRRHRGVEADADQDLGLNERPKRALVELAMVDRRDLGGGAEPPAQDLQSWPGDRAVEHDVHQVSRLPWESRQVPAVSAANHRGGDRRSLTAPGPGVDPFRSAASP